MSSSTAFGRTTGSCLPARAGQGIGRLRRIAGKSRSTGYLPQHRGGAYSKLSFLSWIHLQQWRRMLTLPEEKCSSSIAHHRERFPTRLLALSCITIRPDHGPRSESAKVSYVVEPGERIPDYRRRRPFEISQTDQEHARTCASRSLPIQKSVPAPGPTPPPEFTFQ